MDALAINSSLQQSGNETRLSKTIIILSLLTTAEGRCLGAVCCFPADWQRSLCFCGELLWVDLTALHIWQLCAMGYGCLNVSGYKILCGMAQFFDF